MCCLKKDLQVFWANGQIEVEGYFDRVFSRRLAKQTEFSCSFSAQNFLRIVSTRKQHKNCSSTPGTHKLQLVFQNKFCISLLQWLLFVRHLKMSLNFNCPCNGLYPQSSALFSVMQNIVSYFLLIDVFSYNHFPSIISCCHTAG